MYTYVHTTYDLILLISLSSAFALEGVDSHSLPATHHARHASSAHGLRHLHTYIHILSACILIVRKTINGMYVCMYVCMYECMYMYVCMYDHGSGVGRPSAATLT